MLVAIDIETKGLDATQIIMGCIITERKKKPEIYYKKEDIWNRILELGRAEAKRGAMLNVYSHYATYDTAGYFDWGNKGLKIYSTNPFIASYSENGKEIIKFLDTYALFNTSLKRVGAMLHNFKLLMPDKLLDENMEVTPKLLKEIEPYCVRDTQICLNAVLYLKKKLKEDGVVVKRLYTISQVAINYLLTEWRKLSNQHFFLDPKQNLVYKTLFPTLVHKAYRGGRVECFKTGKFSNVTYIDCNSLYPYASTQIRFPDLRTETKHDNLTISEFLGFHLFSLGISRVLLKNEGCQLGLIPVRTGSKSGNYFPKTGKYIIGTYTHEELELALREGYKLLAIDWSITWEDGANLFKVTTPELYRKRKESKTEFDNFFYKKMLNNSFGKLAQKKLQVEYVIDSVEEAEKYLKNNYEIVHGINTDYMYKKDIPDNYKPYYCPIIPAYINAWSRCYMYKQFKKFEPEQLLYTDTDSIVFQGKPKEHIKETNNMGEFKVEYKDEDILIYGRKTYCIGKDIKISGIRGYQYTKEDFEKGYIESKEMLSFKTAGDTKEIGKFITKGRNLLEQLENHRIVEGLYSEQQLFIDSDIENIDFAVESLKEVM